MSRILVVEDERVIRSEVKRLLVREGHDVAEAETLAEAEEQDLGGFDLIIADLRLPGGHGTELIAKAEGVPVLIMTSYATVRSAIDAMKLGAVDYLSKPFDTDELLMLVDRILSESKLRRQNVALKNDVARTFGQDGMVGHSAPMLEVFERIRKVAPTDATVLVRGESGTGKELVARAIHAESKRRDAAFVAVNCAAIPEGLVESELFGHEKGAFTGAVAVQAGMIEIAHGGTLFLDEIGELPLPAQARLLRVLQQAEIRRVGSSHVRKVDVRVIAATHRDLEEMVRETRFREDLYFRLQVLEIALPPLRDRGEDIEELALALLEKISTRLGRAEVSFTREAMGAVRVHPWPGNVRELENAIERAVILCDDGRITPRLLGIDRPLRSPSLSGASAPASGPNAPASVNGGIGASVNGAGANGAGVNGAGVNGAGVNGAGVNGAGVNGADAVSSDDGALVEYFRKFVLEHQQTMSETELARRLGISRKALWERRHRLGIPRTLRK